MRCHRCGTELQYADQRFCTAEGCDASFPPKLALVVKHRRMLTANETGRLACWVQLVEDGSENYFSQLELEVSAPRLGHLSAPGSMLAAARLEQSVPAQVEVQPFEEGDAPVEFFVVVNEHWVARGTHRVRVGNVQTPGQVVFNPVFHGGNLDGNAVRTGDNFKFEMNGLNLNVDNPEEEHAVALELHPAPSLPPRHSLDLNFSEGHYVTLVAPTDGRVTIGRSSTQDIVLRNGTPKESEEISRQHAWLEFTEAGALWHEVPPKPDKDRNGTTLNDQPKRLRDNETVRLSNHDLLTVAGLVQVNVKLVTEKLDATDEISFARHARRLGQKWTPSVGSCSAVWLECENLLGENARFLVMQRAVRVGSDPCCGLVINDRSIRPIHARIVSLGNRFWIEPANRDAIVCVRGQRVPCGQRAELRGDDEVRLGGTQCMTQVQHTPRSE